MKNMFESPKSFTAHATIGAGYYMLSLQQKELDKYLQRSPIYAAIDKATGYDTAVHVSIASNCAEILVGIIEAKKSISADYKADQEMLDSLNKIISTLTSK